MKKIILGIITCLLSLSVFGQVNEFKFGFPLRANGGLNVGTDKVQLDSIVRDGTTIKFYTGVTELLPNMAGGSVTSVGMTVPTGLSISGSPITGSGTLALTFAPGYSIPSDASQSNWNTAYNWGDHVLGGYQSQSDILDAFAALTNSSGVLTNNGSGGLTWTAVGDLGTVTSVALSVPTGLSVTGSPITSSGTLAISLASGYSIPSTSVQSNWTTAYNERAQWDGGSTNLVASTGRTSLGATTVGSNLFTLNNPNAIRFIRINANNTVSALTATDLKTALSLTASDVGLSTIAFDVSTLQTRTDSIVKALKDTIPLSTALNINFATDTVATKAEVRAVSAVTVGITLNSGTLTLNGSEGTADDITFYTNGDGSYDLPAGGGNLTTMSQVQGWINDSLDVFRPLYVEVADTATMLANYALLSEISEVSIDSLNLNGGSLTLTGDDKLTFETNGNASYSLPAGGGNLTIQSQVQGWINDSLDVFRPLYVEVADTATMLANYALLSEISEVSIDSLNLNGGSLTLTGDDKLTFETNGNASYSLPAGGGNLMIQSATQDMISDSLDAVRADVRLLADTIPIFVFGLGSGRTADTALFNNGAIAGAFYNAGSDTLMITSLRGVLAEGTGTETIGVQVSWHATFKSGSATTLNASAFTVTSITTGDEDTSFAASTIPPNVWVWCTLSGASAGNRPSLLILTMSGYRIPKY